MKLEILAFLASIIGFSAFAASEMHNAYIIEHKSEVISRGKNSEAISGRLGDSPIIYRKNPKVKIKCTPLTYR